MHQLSKLYCWFIGHEMVKECEVDNGLSKHGSFRCMRCGKHHEWQYDYQIF
jgi:transcription elongation factor Elf1